MPATAKADVAAALAGLATTTMRATDERHLVGSLVPVAHELLKADQVHLIELSSDRKVGNASVLLTDGRPPQGYTMVLDEQPSGTGHVVRTGTLLHVADAHESALMRKDFLRRFEVSTVLFVPLCWDGVVRGVCAFAREKQRRFTRTEIDIGSVMGDLFAAGLAMLESRKVADARANQEAALARAVAAVAAGGDRVERLEAVSREACVALGADSAGVYLADGEGGGIATAGHETPEDWLGYRMRPGEGVAGRVFRTGQPAFTNNYRREIRLPTQPGLRRLRTAVALPMRQGDDELTGALSIGFEQMRRIDDGDLRTLEAFANLANVVCADS